MTRFSFQTFIFCLAILAQWTRAIPLVHTVVLTSEEVVFKLVVITRTTVICPSTAPEKSSTLFYTTTSIERSQNSLTKDSRPLGSTAAASQDAGVSMSAIQGSQTSLLSDLTPTSFSVRDILHFESFFISWRHLVVLLIIFICGFRSKYQFNIQIALSHSGTQLVCPIIYFPNRLASSYFITMPLSSPSTIGYLPR